MNKVQTNFVILFEGRNGSSYLTSLLNAHPRALCYPEIMRPLDEPDQLRALDMIVAREDLRKINRYSGHRRYQHTEFWLKWRTRPFAAVGLKTKLIDLKAPDQFIAHMHGLGYRLVYLHRRNILKSVVSVINSYRLRESHNVWNAATPEQAAGPLHIDFAAFDDSLRKRQETEAQHRAAFDGYAGIKTSVCYEDLLADQASFLASLCDFLSLPPAPMSGTFHKTTRDDLRTAIANYDEFRAYFAGTEFAVWLD